MPDDKIAPRIMASTTVRPTIVAAQSVPATAHALELTPGVSTVEQVQSAVVGATAKAATKQLEALGFDTRPLKARPWDLARLEPPALIDLDGHFVLVLATGRGGGVLVGDPRSGLKRLSLQRLEELAGDGLPVLVVREGRTNPSTEGFGLSWFVPALLRYPWLLTLTLVTSFTVQLLQLNSQRAQQQLW